MTDLLRVVVTNDCRPSLSARRRCRDWISSRTGGRWLACKLNETSNGLFVAITGFKSRVFPFTIVSGITAIWEALTCIRSAPTEMTPVIAGMGIFTKSS